MSQIGTPQKNILEPIAGGYPSTTPAAAGESAIVDGQTLVDDSNQETGGRAGAIPTKIKPAINSEVLSPDLPPVNAGALGGPYDPELTAKARAIEGSINAALVENQTVLAQPLSGGPGTGYGAMSGGTPAGVGSDGAGSSGSVQLSLPAISAKGAKNNASINVIARPGDNQAGPFVY
jgi:hypothetical protein